MGMTIEDIKAKLDKSNLDSDTLIELTRMMQSAYNARLKADIAAMLIDLKLEIEESPITDDGIRIEDYSIYERGYEQATLDYSKMIQQKINALKRREDGNDD